MLFISAGTPDNPGQLPTPMPFVIPAGFPNPVMDIYSLNKRTVEGFELGRKLFYDSRLSKDSLVSCGSCHQQFAAFATYDHDLSHGVENTLTTRNAPALINLAWMNAWHWDGGINHIEVQPMSPLTAPNEMGADIKQVLELLKKDSTYPSLFRVAFGAGEINSQKVLKALAQFTGSLVSANSKYDKVKSGEGKFTIAELRGYELFKENCNTCHTEPLFTNNSFRNNGMPQNRFKDLGRQRVSLNAADTLKFKVPTLRNISFSFPYMHDGSIFSIGQVLDHYADKIDTSSVLLDPFLRRKMNMVTKDKFDLLYFLLTLNDTSFIRNPLYSEQGGGGL